MLEILATKRFSGSFVTTFELHQRMTDRGADGVFLDLEPHVKAVVSLGASVGQTDLESPCEAFAAFWTMLGSLMTSALSLISKASSISPI